MIGQTIAGHYHVIEELGRGGFGQTYLAEDLNMPNKHRCVVKQFSPPEDIPSEALEQAKRSFEREAIVLHQLGQEHPQIPRLLAYPEEKGQFFLVQELIEGDDLRSEIQQGERLTEKKVISILDEILKILTFVHQQRVIHRDIKPSNIMRRKKDGKLFLIDFGTVKQQVPTQMVEVQGHVKSQFAFQSPGYTPPEQMQLRPKFASDIYALGMTAIFALTGIHPEGLTIDPETKEVKWREFTNVNPKLADIIDRMVRCNFQERYPSATEAHQALKEFVNPVDHPLPPPKSKSFLGKKLLATTALLFTLGGGSYYFLQQPRTPLFLTYDNPEYDIDVDYPENWVLEKVDDSFGTLARFYLQQSDGENALVTLEAIEIERNISLDDYSNAAINKIIQYLPEAKIIDSRRIELNNIPAHRLVYTGKKKDSDITNKYLQVWFQEKDRIFTMTYVAPEAKYLDFSETVEQTMIPSLVGRKVES